MPRSDRSLIVAAIFGLAAISFGAGLTLGGDWTSKPYEQTGRPYAAADIYAATDLANSFAAYPLEESNACYGAKNHDSADLCAQWRAAIANEKAANVAVWSNRLSVIGAVLTFFGLIFIYRSLEQGRLALDRAGDANTTANAALDLERRKTNNEFRPWLALDAIPDAHLILIDGQADFGIEIGVKNLGKTVARDIIVASQLITGTKVTDRDEAIGRLKAHVLDKRNSPEYHKRVVLPGERIPMFNGVSCEVCEDCIYRLMIYVEYAFDTEPHFTWAMFDVFRKEVDGRDAAIKASNLPLAPDQIRVCASGIGDAA